jgi:hypothetical protein
LWLARLNGGRGREEKRDNSGGWKKIVRVGKSQWLMFDFFTPQGWENPSHTQPQHLVRSENGVSNAIVLFGMLSPFLWASYALLNWQWG